jgi:hypothetical protein
LRLSKLLGGNNLALMTSAAAAQQSNAELDGSILCGEDDHLTQILTPADDVKDIAHTQSAICNSKNSIPGASSSAEAALKFQTNSPLFARKIYHSSEKELDSDDEVIDVCALLSAAFLFFSNIIRAGSSSRAGGSFNSPI